MADTILFLSHGPTAKVPVRAFDNGDGSYSLATAAGAGGGLPTLDPQAQALQAVTTSPLRVLGATGWTLASPNGAAARLVSITNHDTVNALYLALVEVGATLAGSVSTVDYELMLGPGESVVRWQVPAGWDVAVIRGAGTGNVRAQEFLL